MSVLCNDYTFFIAYNPLEFSVHKAQQRAEQIQRWNELLDRVCGPLDFRYNPIPILMRCLNSLFLAPAIIFQPRWKVGRWKSKT